MSSLLVALLATQTLVAQENTAVGRIGRTTITMGGGVVAGAYEVVTDSADARLFFTPHRTFVAGVVAEVRHGRPDGLSFGMRLVRLNGFDRSTDPVRVFRVPFTPQRPFLPYDTARHDVIDGASVALMLGTRFVGIAAGVAAGRWAHESDYPTPGGPLARRTIPIGAIRLGRLTSWHGEVGVGRYMSPLSPGPMTQAGLAHSNADGTRFYRFGLSSEGGYGGVRFQWLGLDVDPYFSFRNPAKRQLGVNCSGSVSLTR